MTSRKRKPIRSKGITNESLADALPAIIPPRSVFRVVRGDKRIPLWNKQVGRVFRIGYYSRQDGLDCIWLVNERGKYERTTDRRFLLGYFQPVRISRETNLFGDNKPQFRAIRSPQGSKRGESRRPRAG